MANRLDDLPTNPAPGLGVAPSKPGTGNSRKVAAGASRSRHDERLPRFAGNRLPPPTRPPRSIPVAAAIGAPPVMAPRANVEPARGAAPPLATVAGTILRAAEDTQIVTPLPSPLEPAKPRRGRAATPRVIVDRALVESAARRIAIRVGRAIATLRYSGVGGVIGAAVLVALVAVVAIGFSSDDVTRTPATRDLAEAPEAITVEPLPPPPPRGARAEPPDIAVPAVGEPRAAAPAAIPHEVRAPRPPRSRGKIAPASPRSKPARALAYDPDALFLKKP